MEEERGLKEIIMERQANQSISCKTALEVARQTGTAPGEIGKLLNEMEIKVRACQLGCFK